MTAARACWLSTSGAGRIFRADSQRDFASKGIEPASGRADATPSSRLWRCGHPDVALLDLLDQRPRIEFARAPRLLEQLGGLWFIVDALGRDDGTVVGLDSQRESSRAVDPADQMTTRGRNGVIDQCFASADDLGWRRLAAPIALIRQSRDLGHRLPLLAGIVGIDRNEQPRQCRRLAGFH